MTHPSHLLKIWLQNLFDQGGCLQGFGVTTVKDSRQPREYFCTRFSSLYPRGKSDWKRCLRFLGFPASLRLKDSAFLISKERRSGGQSINLTSGISIKTEDGDGSIYCMRSPALETFKANELQSWHFTNKYIVPSLFWYFKYVLGKLSWSHLIFKLTEAGVEVKCTHLKQYSEL